MLRRWRRACRRRGRCVARRRDLVIVERVLFEGWTSRELAAALGAPLSPGAIDTLVHRVRRRLAAEAASDPGQPSAACSTSPVARRDRTACARFLSNETILKFFSCPRSASRFLPVFVSMSDPGKKAFPPPMST